MKHARPFRALMLATILLLFSACSVGSNSATPRAETDVVIGSYPFTESRVLAHVYAAALERAGWDARLEADVSSRELMIPALEQGLVDLVPEYEGTLKVFLEGVASISGAEHGIELGLDERHLVALDRAPAQNKNEFVVTGATARRLHLRTISDLASVSLDLVIGGPPECPARQLCLLGLESTYGISFAAFNPVDTGGPLTLAALRGGEIDVGVLFTTDPALSDTDLVVLKDDLRLQPPEHIIPVISASSSSTLGPSMRRVIDNVTAQLSTVTVRELNRQVSVLGRDPALVADEWVVRNL